MYKKLLFIMLFSHSLFAGREFIDFSEQRLLEIQSQLYQILTQLGYYLQSRDDYEKLSLMERKRWIGKFHQINDEFNKIKNDKTIHRDYDLIEQIEDEIKHNRKKIYRAKRRLNRELLINR